MIRLHKLRMTDWRSIVDTEIVIGDGAPTLLYGENDAGKSNILAAIEAFCRLFSHAVSEGLTKHGEYFSWTERVAGGTSAEGVVQLSHPIRYGVTRATLAGELVDAAGHAVSARFDITLEPAQLDVDRTTYKVQIAQFDSAAVEHLPDVLRVGEGRSFHTEFLPQQSLAAASSSITPDTIAPDGTGAKLALFRCANHVKPEVRGRFNHVFKQLVNSSPFDLPEPIVAIGDRLEIQVLIGDRPVEERGAGPQQWVLAAAMIAATDPDIVLFEEPETNLSWRAQQQLVGMLQTMASRRQAVIATHSPHLGNLAGRDGPWYRVQHDAREGTTLTRCSGVDSLWEAYQLSLENTENPDDPRKLTLFPGNVLRLHEAGVRHLGISTGDVVVTSLQPNRIVQMQALDAWLADDNTSK